MIIKGIYAMIRPIINGKLTKDIVVKTLQIFIKYTKIDTTINKKRICKTPFKKWYIKGYTHKSDYNKIVKYILGYNDDLNKNLKMKKNNIRIIQINYIN